MNAVRQIIRGCGYLPHVGEHPGTGMIVLFVIMGAVAGLHAGWRGALGGALLMGAVFGPMYLYGAWDRANISDRITAKSAIPSSSGDV